MKESFRTRVVSVLVLAVALLLRLWHLGKQSLWMDEGFSVWISSYPISSLLKIVRFDLHPPLYYLLLHFWLKAGHNEAFLRFPSIISGTANVLILYFLGRRLAGDRLATWLAFFWACSFLAMDSETQVRMYAPASTLTLLSAWLLWEAFHSGSRKLWLLYVAVATLSLYTHYYSGFVILAEFLFLIFSGAGSKALKVALIVMLLFVPIVPMLLNQFSHHSDVALPVASGKDVLLFSASMIGIEEFIMKSDPARICVGTAVVLLALFGIIQLAKESRDKAFFLLLLCAVPGIAPFAINRLTSHHIFLFRYVVFFAPYLLLLFFLALREIHAMLFTGLTVFLILVNVGMWQIFVTAPGSERQNWREGSRILRDSVQPGDPILFEQSMSVYPLSYYLSGAIRVGWDIEHPGMNIISLNPEKGVWIPLDGFGSPSSFVAAAGPWNRVGLVLCQESRVDPQEMALTWLTRHRHLVKSITLASFRPGNEIRIFLFEGNVR